MFYENIGVPLRSSTKYSVALGLVLLLVGMGYSVHLYKKASTPVVPEGMTSQQQSATRSAMPLTSSPKTSRISLVMPAGVGSKSELFRYTPSMLRKMQDEHLCIVAEGNSFEFHTVYENGTECIGGGCAAGPQKGVYATNKSEAKESNTISLAFEAC